jgi:hypothetical protein
VPAQFLGSGRGDESRGIGDRRIRSLIHYKQTLNPRCNATLPQSANPSEPSALASGLRFPMVYFAGCSGPRLAPTAHNECIMR